MSDILQLRKSRRKQTGEDFTPSELVNEILDQLPIDIWLDPDKTWLDPTAGNGVATLVPFRELLKCQPQIWDNAPMEGFKILESVSRYSTSNKLWRILDPRNMEFEITTGCLESIMMATTITKGLIEGKCVWAASKNLVVV